eukprot:TRINITY_DN301_c0_g1_i1.p1 TRINITY_DN301_c0_g1~~TRINITY_DN301_c0_g1_i1.p1  ORF type:complete len:546 (-),score=117.74 TRINITY_DN301_c0_g1_i1:1392-3029(-)
MADDLPAAEGSHSNIHDDDVDALLADIMPNIGEAVDPELDDEETAFLISTSPTLPSPLLLPEINTSGNSDDDDGSNNSDDYLPPSPSNAFPLHSPVARSVRAKYMSRLGYKPLRFTTTDSPSSTLSPTRPKLVREKSKLAHTLRAGGTVSSIFNLCSATLGAGALSLPFVFATCGIIMALGLLLFGALATIFSIKLLIWCRTRARLATYEDLAMKFFSNRGALFVEITIILFCFGTCIAYTVAIADVVHPIVAQYILPNGSLFANRNVLIVLLVLIVILPLSMLESLGSLRFANMLGVFSVFYLVVSVTIHSIIHMSNYGFPKLGPDQLFQMSWSNLFMSLPVVMFAFTCQVNVFSIYTELHRPCIRRMDRVVSRAVYVIFMLYGSIGFFGFLEHGERTSQDILHNYRIVDPIMAAAQLCVGFTLIVAYPLNLLPCRNTMEMMLFAEKQPSKTRKFVLTCFIICMSTILAIIVPGINAVFVIMGSVCSSIICYILPGVFYLKAMHGSPFSREKFGAWILIFVGATVGIISTTMSVMQFANPSSDS